MRKRCGLRLNDLSRKTGVSRNAIARAERDESRPRPQVLGRVLPALACAFQAAFPESAGDPYDFLIPPKTLGALIKNRRMRCGMQLKDLAKKLGVRPFTVIRYEADASTPQAKVRERLRRVLGMDVRDEKLT